MTWGVSLCPCPTDHSGVGLVSKTHKLVGIRIWNARAIPRSLPGLRTGHPCGSGGTERKQNSAEQGLGDCSDPIPRECQAVKEPHSTDSVFKYCCREHLLPPRRTCISKSQLILSRPGFIQVPSSEVIAHSSCAQGVVSLQTAVPCLQQVIQRSMAQSEL